MSFSGNYYHFDKLYSKRMLRLACFINYSTRGSIGTHLLPPFVTNDSIETSLKVNKSKQLGKIDFNYATYLQKKKKEKRKLQKATNQINANSQVTNNKVPRVY